MTEGFTEIPRDEKYSGLTRYTKDGRHFASLGVGPAVREALRRAAQK